MDLTIEIPPSPKSNNSKTSDLSDWTSVSHEELNITLPQIEKTRAKDEVKIVHIKHKDKIKKITNKITGIVKTTFKTINHENVHCLILLVMKELEKLGLKNCEKKELAKLIIVYCLDSLAISPHIINYYTIELLDGLIEMVYFHSFHLFGKKKKGCLCF